MSSVPEPNLSRFSRRRTAKTCQFARRGARSSTHTQDRHVQTRHARPPKSDPDQELEKAETMYTGARAWQVVAAPERRHDWLESSERVIRGLILIQRPVVQSCKSITKQANDHSPEVIRCVSSAQHCLAAPLLLVHELARARDNHPVISFTAF